MCKAYRERKRDMRVHFYKQSLRKAWRRIEVVITGLTRNQLAGQPARGFESRRLRL